MQRTFFATLRHLSIWAAIRISLMRPLVQEPITDWSIFTSLTSSIVRVFSGRWGMDTVGRRAERSIVTVRVYSASGSAS